MDEDDNLLDLEMIHRESRLIIRLPDLNECRAVFPNQFEERWAIRQAAAGTGDR